MKKTVLPIALYENIYRPNDKTIRYACLENKNELKRQSLTDGEQGEAEVE